MVTGALRDWRPFGRTLQCLWVAGVLFLGRHGAGGRSALLEDCGGRSMVLYRTVRIRPVTAGHCVL